jgi:hypothetical protein
VQVDFTLKRGVWVRGRVLDKEGRPVRAKVRYGAFLDNPNARGVRGYDGSADAVTGPDGSFAVLALPGRGLLAVKADEDRYLVGVGADRVKPADKTVTNFVLIRTHPAFIPEEYHAFAPVEPDNRGATCDVVLDPGRSVKGILVGPDGKPLSGVTVLDLKLVWSNPRPLPGPDFTATVLDPGGSRRIYFLHREKRLGAAVLVRGDTKEPLTVRLRPCGSVAGRLLDAKGRPRAGVDIYGQSEDKRMSVSGRWWGLYVSGRTDKEGRFRIEGLIPGVTYHVGIGAGQQIFTLTAGEVKDVGDLTVNVTPE